ncbi:hypothetical protein PC129_g20334 [Phytophthora cactorum]|uniref:Uncharacterized protein n=1 Tax=Phytophthora cactorum TaxID=29920 RepID=A0A329RCX5_9STRA|nr:hypothetical protein Pcac1_g14042 [Phytophthora cactorum]KAG2797610.1 hypothetical protein PC111_g21219 [Phytophthora cactorum]KAG2797726.1 hypothetical protein PC112_g21656 [Phytophthora cactorum]KAG2827638.1 hypothetical protein PC113_g21588 [Phytophthora cactorum]KAG2876746.1 hypothetical protein PC114_g24035 [Phytophthora cactorum]
MPEPAKVLQEGLDTDFSDSQLNDEQKELILALLESFRGLFEETPLKPGRTDMLEFSIDTGDHLSIKQRSCRVSKAKGDVMEAEIQPYFESNFIRPRVGPWNSPSCALRYSTNLERR